MSLNIRQLFRMSWLALTALPEIHISHGSSSMLDLGLVRLVPPGSYASLSETLLAHLSRAFPARLQG